MQKQLKFRFLGKN